MKKKNLYQGLIILAFVIFAIGLFWIVFTSPFSVQMNGSIIIASAFVLLFVTNYLSFKLGF